MNTMETLNSSSHEICNWATLILVVKENENVHLLKHVDMFWTKENLEIQHKKKKTIRKPSIDNFDLKGKKKKPMQKYRFLYVIHETVERTSHWLNRIIPEIEKEKNGNAIKML